MTTQKYEILLPRPCKYCVIFIDNEVGEVDGRGSQTCESVALKPENNRNDWKL